MVPLGYTWKRITPRPEWLAVEHVTDVLALSDCTSPNFTDWFSNTDHNGFYLFDSPAIVRALAEGHGVPLEGLRLFYFEAFELEYDEERRTWSTFAPDPSFVTKVEVPSARVLQGFDVVCIEGASAPGCSPLSCNGLASSIRTNEHCLIPTMDEARKALEEGLFQRCEPGPYRIVGVYTIEHG